MTATDTGIAELLRVAHDACRNASAPYSNFSVGVGMRTMAGNVYAGCNVETANYGLSICAERTAIVSAVTAEGPAMRIADIVIVTGHGSIAAPCGSCRQVLYEFGPHCMITLVGDDASARHSIAELLPHPFGSEDLIGSGPARR